VKRPELFTSFCCAMTDVSAIILLVEVKLWNRRVASFTWERP